MASKFDYDAFTDFYDGHTLLAVNQLENNLQKATAIATRELGTEELVARTGYVRYGYYTNATIAATEKGEREMRLIDADELERMCENPEYTLYNGNMLAEWMKHCIVTAPTIEAEPVRHGHWIEKQTTIQCSNCGKEYNDEIRCMCYGEDAELNHCPKCGAKMDEKE